MQRFQFSEEQRARHRAVEAVCRTMALDPGRAEPLFIVYTPVAGLPSCREQVEDPARMFAAELARLQSHLDVGDDYLPTIRVQFGTGQVAAAFGCPIRVLDDSLPACAGPVIRNAGEVAALPRPALTAGWYGRLRDFTEYFLEHLPAGAVVQHPDIQSPFNTAHLIRGDGIFTDFYDAPEVVDALLDRVTDYLLELIPWLKRQISSDPDWFYDSGVLWKGAARISNCSMQMISPEFYERHVLPRDARLLHAIGGGRVHYCGLVDRVIYKYFRIPDVTGVDYDGRHDLWALSAAAPPAVVLMQAVEAGSPLYRRLAAGDWPAKRNLVLVGWLPSVEEGRRWLRELRDGWARHLERAGGPQA